MRFVASAVLVWSLCFTLGCAQTRGYAGPEREPSELATIRGDVHVVPGTLNTFAVTITSVNGSDSFENWSARTVFVDLLPGRYVVGVMADWEGGGLAVMAIDAFNDEHPREFEIDVQAGHTYLIHFDRNGKYYLLKDLPDPGVREARFPARGDRERCELALTPLDRELCEVEVWSRGSDDEGA